MAAVPPAFISTSGRVADREDEMLVTDPKAPAADRLRIWIRWTPETVRCQAKRDTPASLMPALGSEACVRAPERLNGRVQSASAAGAATARTAAPSAPARARRQERETPRMGHTSSGGVPPTLFGCDPGGQPGRRSSP